MIFNRVRVAQRVEELKKKAEQMQPNEPAKP